MASACDGRFTDAWVVDRTLFEYINQGSCSCCGSSHAMMDVAHLMMSCSDIETDDGRREKESPWPAFMAAEVWADRVKLRKLLKAEMADYRRWWAESAEAFTAWWETVPIDRKRRMAALPSADVLDALAHTYNVRTAYMTVLCAVNEQVKNFNVTGMEPDGRTPAEIAFEKELQFQRGAYTVSEPYLAGSGFTDLCAYLGTTDKLLPRAPPSTAAPSPDGSDADDDERHASDEEGEEKGTGEGGGKGGTDNPSGDGDAGGQQSFRADRRLVRLVVARHMVRVARSNFAQAQTRNRDT